ncbi:MAG: nicotinate phosphoribosyltransferase, partial [Promethearchaeota archaeon]
HYNRKGLFRRDTLARWNEPIPSGKPLLVPIIQKGQLVYDFPSLDDSRTYCKTQLDCLPKRYRKLSNAAIYPVGLSHQLSRIKNRLQRK